MFFRYNLINFLLLITTIETQASVKFKHVMETLGACTGPDYSDIESPITNIKFEKINHTAKTLSFDMNLSRPIDNNTCIVMKFQKLTNAITKEMPFLSCIHDPCNLFLRTYREIWVGMMGAMGVTRPDKCPIPAGRYSLRKYVFNVEYKDSYSIPMKGRFVVRSAITDIATKKIIACMEAISNHYIDVDN